MDRTKLLMAIARLESEGKALAAAMLRKLL